jgi:hypothetical protein
MNEILSIIKELNSLYPDVRFGQIIDCCYNKNIEDLFYLSDEEIKMRLRLILRDVKREKNV